jgi:Zn-dependent protease with chaperone function
VATGSDVSGLGIKVTDLALRGFSREQESEADEFGLALVYTHYGHVDEAWRLFERWDEGDESLLDIVSYLSTHPDSGDRIDDLEEQAVREGWPVEGSTTALKW